MELHLTISPLRRSSWPWPLLVFIDHHTTIISASVDHQKIVVTSIGPFLPPVTHPMLFCPRSNASKGVIEALRHHLWRWQMVEFADIGIPKVCKAAILAFDHLKARGANRDYDDAECNLVRAVDADEVRVRAQSQHLRRCHDRFRRSPGEMGD
ncbi:hypothetical protein E4U32_002504 [Claviceps aff. humidiphila group G2b]|nr:hypothetical protein E4U32_002504 [Claviceps aff. humidiphila group G2b]